MTSPHTGITSFLRRIPSPLARWQIPTLSEHPKKNVVIPAQAGIQNTLLKSFFAPSAWRTPLRMTVNGADGQLAPRCTDGRAGKVAAGLWSACWRHASRRASALKAQARLRNPK